MKIVVVSGASKDVGKTTLAVTIIEEHPGVAALKYSLDFDGDGAGVVTDPRIVAQPKSDTGRFLKAGAKPVFWVRSDESNLGLHLKKALSLLPTGARVIIEGNSVIRHLKPALSIFIMNSSLEKAKPSALNVLRSADFIVGNSEDGQTREKIAHLNSRARFLFFDPLKPKGKDLELLLRELDNVWRD